MPNIGPGVKIASDIRGPAFDPTTGDRTPSAAGERAARDFLAARLPALACAPDRRRARGLPIRRDAGLAPDHRAASCVEKHLDFRGRRIGSRLQTRPVRWKMRGGLCGG